MDYLTNFTSSCITCEQLECGLHVEELYVSRDFNGDKTGIFLNSRIRHSRLRYCMGWRDILAVANAWIIVLATQWVNEALGHM